MNHFIMIVLHIPMLIRMIMIVDLHPKALNILKFSMRIKLIPFIIVRCLKTLLPNQDHTLLIRR